MSEPPTFAIHVDCDPLWIYEQEYGVRLGSPDAIYEHALPALLDLFRDLGVSATFFVIGSELQKASCQSFCLQALAAGHTLGNHSHTHPTNFANMTAEQRSLEIGRCHDALNALGCTPAAYRSPGYFYSDDIGETLNRKGYLYDSSILPGPASLLMSLYLHARGKAKNKSFGVRQNLFASRRVRRLKNGLLQVPIAIIPYLRMPIHSTFIYQFGLRYLEIGLSILQRTPGHHVILLHAIDLVDLGADATSPVIPLRWSLQSRRDMLTGMISVIRYDVKITEDALANARSKR